MPINNNEKLLQTVEKHSKEQAKNYRENEKPSGSGKTNKFLQAIQRYAIEQKNAMKGEAKQLKTERLKEAEKTARRESERLVKETLRSARINRTAALAQKTQEGQKELFKERSRMVEEIFGAAAEKLAEYTLTEEYTIRLTESAKAISDLFGEKACVIYVKKGESALAEGFKSLFKGGAEILVDESIKIGGIIGYCADLGIIADETLDSKLNAQREWFIENSSLTVL